MSTPYPLFCSCFSRNGAFILSVCVCSSCHFSLTLSSFRITPLLSSFPLLYPPPPSSHRRWLVSVNRCHNRTQRRHYAAKLRQTITASCPRECAHLKCECYIANRSPRMPACVSVLVTSYDIHHSCEEYTASAGQIGQNLFRPSICDTVYDGFDRTPSTHTARQTHMCEACPPYACFVCLCSDWTS